VLFFFNCVKGFEICMAEFLVFQSSNQGGKRDKFLVRAIKSAHKTRSHKTGSFPLFFPDSSLKKALSPP
jgi:hypothetical protein